MFLTWLIVCLGWHLLYGNVPALAWLLLIPFFVGAYGKFRIEFSRAVTGKP